jgi:hypothetical protein
VLASNSRRTAAATEKERAGYNSVFDDVYVIVKYDI